MSLEIYNCSMYGCLFPAYLCWMLFCGISVLVDSALVAFVAVSKCVLLKYYVIYLLLRVTFCEECVALYN